MSIYSQSGFDVVKAFQLVVNRSNAVVDLGIVDLGCAFVVCDANITDCPVVYASDAFRYLTGYKTDEIIGRNCRFLQAPDGRVDAGSVREYTDNEAVCTMKRMVDEKKEVRQHLLNYRKTGQPFVNVVTLVPIPWEGTEGRYIIGFQTDADGAFGGALVNPCAELITQANQADHIYPTQGAPMEAEHETLTNDGVSMLLQQHLLNLDNSKANLDDSRIYEMLINNSDDIIQVLSLKGVFFYISPSCKPILGYDPAELRGQSLSTLCHPSDQVLVMRTLREAKINYPISLLFRIRSKDWHYIWFESCGSLYRQKTGARGFVILAGRQRAAFSLKTSDLDANGGISDDEFWSKISVSGIFLFVSKRSNAVLDLPAESLVGTRIQELVQDESLPFLEVALETAKRGDISMSSHYVRYGNEVGSAVHVQTIFYPGDSLPGAKSSFLLAQARIITASTRSIASTVAPSNASVSGSIRQGSINNNTRNLEVDLFDDLTAAENTNWQFMVRELERNNEVLAAELEALSNNERRKTRAEGCANCHTKTSPEWRRGPSGQRDLCNRCGLRWAKKNKRTATD